MNLNELNFKDFNPDELVGKYVLCNRHNYLSDSPLQSIDTIVKVTKTGFRISAFPNTLFDFHGTERGGMRFHKMTCKLLSVSQAESIRKTWHENRLKRELIDKITKDLPKCDLSVVTAVSELVRINKLDK